MAHDGIGYRKTLKLPKTTAANISQPDTKKCYFQSFVRCCSQFLSKSEQQRFEEIWKRALRKYQNPLNFHRRPISSLGPFVEAEVGGWLNTSESVWSRACWNHLSKLQNAFFSKVKNIFAMQCWVRHLAESVWRKDLPGIFSCSKCKYSEHSLIIDKKEETLTCQSF